VFNGEFYFILNTVEFFFDCGFFSGYTFTSKLLLAKSIKATVEERAPGINGSGIAVRGNGGTRNGRGGACWWYSSEATTAASPQDHVLDQCCVPVRGPMGSHGSPILEILILSKSSKQRYYEQCFAVHQRCLHSNPNSMAAAHAHHHSIKADLVSRYDDGVRIEVSW
jgi:hypothetical protein